MTAANAFLKSRNKPKIMLLGLVSCGMMVGLVFGESTSLTAQAFPFFHKRKPVEKNLPPSAQTRPGMLETPPVPPVVKTPVVAPDPTQLLIQRGVFPPDAITRAEPVTRAEWAGILVRAIGHNTKQYSEFPFYRDVPVTDRDYVNIEVAREKKLVTHNGDHGFYYPKRPLTYAEAYESIAQAITGPPPSSEMWPHLLQTFSDRDQLPREAVPAVAKMVRVRFFKTPKPQTELHPNAPVTFVGITPMVTDLIHLIQQRTPLQAERETASATLPAGLELTLSPATSILEASLNVGQNVSFMLVNPTGPLPKESRFEGQIVSATPSARTYTVELTSAKTPEGGDYRTEAQFTISFSPRSRINFLVPGELYSAVTRLPEEGTTRPTTGAPASPATGSNSKVIPPFSPSSGAQAPTTPQPAPAGKPTIMPQSAQ